jgi:hypothetical protein
MIPKLALNNIADYMLLAVIVGMVFSFLAMLLH